MQSVIHAGLNPKDSAGVSLMCAGTSVRSLRMVAEEVPATLNFRLDPRTSWSSWSADLRQQWSSSERCGGHLKTWKTLKGRSGRNVLPAKRWAAAFASSWRCGREDWLTQGKVHHSNPAEVRWRCGLLLKCFCARKLHLCQKYRVKEAGFLFLSLQFKSPS